MQRMSWLGVDSVECVNTIIHGDFQLILNFKEFISVIIAD
jgi:hypothetical protein